MNKHRFVWHDLNTKDAEGAKRFYGELFNWKFEKGDKGPYLHIKAGNEMIGGVRQMEPNEKGPNAWLGYVACDDVAATVSSIGKHGGKVMMPTMTMDQVGTFAVVADPTGGVFAPWKSARAGEDVEKDTMPGPFTFCWDELLTTDPAAAKKFYAGVFGWEPQDMDMGPGGIYTLLNRPGTKGPRGPKGAGGIMKAPPMVPHSFWMAYIAVENVDQINDKAKKHGANVLVPPTDIPNVGRFACWMDPQQAAISVISFPKP
jgi:predicted enzyme related to lactoylglutathione lyase